MDRTLTNLLICLTLGLTLVISGGNVATARLTMALEAATTTELVICADGQVETVMLNANGEPVPSKLKDQCAKCPDWRLAMALAFLSSAVTASDEQSRTIEAQSLRVRFDLLPLEGLQQPRAPPKGL
jgi:uncharacterized protein (DUF736 family)